MVAHRRDSASTIGLGILLMLMLAAMGMVVPWHTDALLRCKYCRASASQRRILLIPMPLRVTEGDLSCYWLKNVDVNHQHEWAAIATGYTFTYGSGISDHAIGVPRGALDDRCSIPILQSLPSPVARQAFIRYLWDNGAGPNRNRTRDIVCELRMAYDENPKRTDWAAVLKKLGCYPSVPAVQPAGAGTEQRRQH